MWLRLCSIFFRNVKLNSSSSDVEWIKTPSSKSQQFFNINKWEIIEILNKGKSVNFSRIDKLSVYFSWFANISMTEDFELWHFPFQPANIQMKSCLHALYVISKSSIQYSDRLASFAPQTFQINSGYIIFPNSISVCKVMYYFHIEMIKRMWIVQPWEYTRP